MIKVRTTYEIVTPESAEHGEVADRGWITAHGLHIDDYSPECEETLTFREWSNLTDCTEPSSSGFHKGVWYTYSDYNTDMRTCAEESRSYHLDKDTPEALQAILYKIAINDISHEQGELEWLVECLKGADKTIHVAESDGRNNLPALENGFLFAFGAYGDTFVLGFGRGIESALESAAEKLKEVAPRHFTEPDYKEAAEEMGKEWPLSGEDLDNEELCDSIHNAAECDLTYTESGWLVSHEWQIVGEGMSHDEIVKFANA